MARAQPGCPAAAAVAWALASCVALVEGGLKTKPPGGRGAGEPRRLQNSNSLSGLEYVASGYDVFFGNPDPTSGSVDEGFRSPVFKIKFGSEMLPDQNTKVPDGFSALKCEGSCSLSSKLTSIKSMDQYQDFLSTSASLEVGFGDIASFAASMDFQRMRSGFEDHESVYTSVVAHCCSYEAFVQTYRPPPADENFLAAVDMAPVHYDQDFYFEIIGEFGTHFLSSALLGSMYGEETEFTRDQYNDMKAAKNDWWVSAKASFIVSIQAGASSQADTMQKEFFDKYSSTTKRYSLGTVPPSDGKPETWLQTTKVQPVPTSIKLKPLSELFTTLMVPKEANLTKLNAKKKNMERALQEYCPEKLLREGKVDSCDKIMYDPDASAADDKTCLAKVWGGGGPHGQPFDDSNLMVELYGLYSNLYVSQIDYQCDRWLDNIKLVLSSGNNEWPLPEHGGKGGRPNTLTFSAGQRITAVGLSYGRYVDKMTFWTNDGYQQSVGGGGGAHSKMVNFQDTVRNAIGRLPRDAWLVGLYGYSQQYVDSIGFYVAYTCSSSEVPGPAGAPAGAPSQAVGGASTTAAAGAASTTSAAAAAGPPA